MRAFTPALGAPQLVGNRESIVEADSHPESQAGGFWRAFRVLTEGISAFHTMACKALCGRTPCSLFDLSSCFPPPGSPHSSCPGFLADPEHAKYTSPLPPHDPSLAAPIAQKALLLDISSSCTLFPFGSLFKRHLTGDPVPPSLSVSAPSRSGGRGWRCLLWEVLKRASQEARGLALTAPIMATKLTGLQKNRATHGARSRPVQERLINNI